MRRRLLLLISICAISLSGCSEYNQLENLAYGIILGIDLTEEEQIELVLQVPRISASGGESPSGNSGTEPLLYSSSGSSFEEALNMLQWAVPRKLSLTQLKLILVSENLARSERFSHVMSAIMSTNNIYTAAYIAVCQGNALDFIKAENQMIGASIFTELEAMFEDYTHNGFIPDVTFADLYFKANSLYSDPLAIYAVSDKEGMLKTDQSDQSSAPASSLITPSDPEMSNVKTTQANRFLGAAMFQGSKMVGALTGDQVIHTMLLRGRQITFPYTKEGKTVYLTRIGYPSVKIDTKAEPMKISIRLRLSVLPDSATLDLTGMELDIAEQLRNTINACRKMNSEPFQFAENAAKHFLTVNQWKTFDWKRHFEQSDVDISVNLRYENR